MDKEKIFEKYKNEEEKILISKLLDKIGYVERQNKLHNTDFLSPLELQILENVLNIINYKNYIVYGGIEEAQRNIIILFPEKLKELFYEKSFNYNSICNCIRIVNKSENYNHKVYLGGLMKLGIKREKIGDIVVYDNGADIIVNTDITKFILSNLKELTRFKKSEITVIDIKNVIQKKQEYKDVKVIVSSLRLDNVVSELSRTSRSKANEILKQERVFVNYKNETKNTKIIQCKDLITIRGCGKFIIDEIRGNTKNGKTIIKVKKFI